MFQWLFANNAACDSAAGYLLCNCFQKKGYVYGISRTGLIMGTIGLAMLTLAIFITLVGLV